MLEFCDKSLILIALGANLPSERFGPPRATLEASLDMLPEWGVQPIARSSWYESAPVPPSGQPWFVNAVAAVECALPPGALMKAMHAVEAALGRTREGAAVNAPRAADLDLLDYKGLCTGPHDWPCLPHPRLQERAFVVVPLAELVPDWRHPVSGVPVRALADDLHDSGACRRLPD